MIRWLKQLLCFHNWEYINSECDTDNMVHTYKCTKCDKFKITEGWQRK